MTTKNVRSTLRYQRVYRELRARILSGHYEVGAQIETEPELTEQFKVSIITVRQAESMLEDDGLLDRQQGRGTFVPRSARGRLKVLCVVGLSLTQGLRNRMGTYHSDLVLLSQQETARMGMEFETVWLDPHDPERLKPYLDASTLREYWGFVFVASGVNHPLLQRVRKLGSRYVVISPHVTDERRRVWLDLNEGIELGLRAFDSPPLIMGIDSLQTGIEAVLQGMGLKAKQVYMPAISESRGIEAVSFHRTLELHRERVDLSRILILDDVVAHGVTRALLKAGYTDGGVKLVVLCGRQEMIPLGLPIMYVLHDTVEEVRHAFEILTRVPNANEDLSWRSGFRLVTEAN